MTAWVAGALAISGAALVLFNMQAQVISRLSGEAAAQALKPVPASGIAELHANFRRDGRAMVGGGAPDPSLVRFVNGRLPLNPVPYTSAANAALAANETDRAIGLLEFALRQDPRSKPVRLALAQQYLAIGRTKDGAREVFALAELPGSIGELMMSVVRQGSVDPVFRRNILELVEERPERANSYYRYLRGDDAVSLPLSLALIRQAPPTGSNARAILPLLIRAGHVEEARLLYRHNNPSRAGGAIAWPVDPSFAEGFGNGIFSWKDVASDRGRAAPIGPSAWGAQRALAVSFEGGPETLLLQQTTAMPAGTYRWTLPYHVDLVRGGASTLTWRVRCEGGDVVGTAAIEAPDEGEGSTGLSVVVPDGEACRTQTFELLARSEDEGAEIDIQFRGFETREGASR
ncbi:tetratricopeptide repeat protein [Qipengyuania sp. JC766]|uniref:tetratricopeptide repeat protein n=1 Tax=Qipengyuania sp. JC766 TaxID=3232139 RepID=UPI0034580249